MGTYVKLMYNSVGKHKQGSGECTLIENIE
jgi:hypothetical protein